MASLLEMNTGVSGDQIRTFLSRTATLSALLDRECIAAAVTQEDFDVSQRTGGDFCKFVKVGAPLFMLNWGAPVSPRVHRALVYHQTVLENVGEWERALRMHRFDNVCLTKLEEDEFASMGLAQFSGPFGISVFLGSTGVAVTWLKRRAGPPPELARAGPPPELARAGPPPELAKKKFEQIMPEQESTMPTSISKWALEVPVARGELKEASAKPKSRVRSSSGSSSGSSSKRSSAACVLEI